MVIHRTDLQKLPDTGSEDRAHEHEHNGEQCKRRAKSSLALLLHQRFEIDIVSSLDRRLEIKQFAVFLTFERRQFRHVKALLLTFLLLLHLIYAVVDLQFAELIDHRNLGRVDPQKKPAVMVDDRKFQRLLRLLAVIGNVNFFVSDTFLLVLAQENVVLVPHGIPVRGFVYLRSDNLAVGEFDHGIAIVVDKIFLVRYQKNQAILRHLL